MLSAYFAGRSECLKVTAPRVANVTAEQFDSAVGLNTLPTVTAPGDIGKAQAAP